MMIDIKNLLIEVSKDIQEIKKENKEIKKIISSAPKWISASDVAKDRKLKTQSVLKQLKNGDFEPEVEYKLIGNKMYIAKSAIFKIKRLRK